MPQPIRFYKTQLDTFKLQVNRFNKHLVGLSFIRLAVFVLTVIGIYFTYTNWQITAAISVVGIAAFLITLSKYTDAKRERDLNKALVKINEEELRIASGEFHHRDKGAEFQDSKHFYSLDIDLFGNGSFFQFINRTAITEGKTALANLLKANNITNIKLKQEAIQELSSKPEWRQLYSATASLIHVEVSAKNIIKWLTQHKQFLPKIIRWLPMMFSGISVLFFVLFLFKTLDVSILGYWLLLGLFITGAYVKKINVLSSQTDKAKDTFKQYSQLLKQIESTSFSSELLQEKQQKIQSDHKKASIIFKHFSKYLDALDNRNNLIGAIFGNGLFLTDLKNSYKIEQWIATYNKTVADWFEVVTFFDAYNSLGNYAFNHPRFVFPELVDSHVCIKAKQLGHPLLQADKRVDSDLNIDNE
ncbi:DNA mismatch repair protein MutS [Mangrovimonas spongiae]|uniref:DNA mismatch repair protein MutS n=1 Tax=Mangrovimonas spongiae TaxID=2494697 RepID=UPI0029371694|nr:DNA mismatch repair protein MutS [Mangrovimonas spongiae]